METPSQHNGEPDGMRPMARAGRINLIILLSYAAFFFVFVYLGNGGDLAAWAISVGLGMMAQGVLNLVLGILFFIGKKPDWGKATLLSGFVLLIIGFSACTGAFSVTGFH